MIYFRGRMCVYHCKALNFINPKRKEKKIETEKERKRERERERERAWYLG
jgi:hypothetical protein